MEHGSGVTLSGGLGRFDELGGWIFNVNAKPTDDSLERVVATGGPYESEEECTMELKKCIRFVAETIELAIEGKLSGKYIDLRAGGALRSWDSGFQDA